MADAAVEFLLTNLFELAKYNIDLVRTLDSEVKLLEKDLRLFQTFLNNTRKLRRKDESIAELARQIRDVVYEAEDIIDTFVTQATEKTKTRSRFRKAVPAAPFSLIPIAEKVKSIRSEVSAMEKKMGLASQSVAAGGKEEKVVPIVREDNVVGFKDEAKTIIGYLSEPTNELDVISIIGMPGLGKTTLAGMIFRDPDLEYAFPIRIWVYISQEFTMKDVFLNLLSKLTSIPNDDLSRKNDQELAKLVACALQSGNFLIVLDDVWSAEDWHGKLEIAFPKVVTRGKILITSRNKEVGVVANHTRAPHELRFLFPDEGWELLQLEVFGKVESRPAGLEGWGRVIVKKCAMLPLAIVVIGGFLAKKTSVVDETSHTIDAWAKFSDKVSGYVTNDDPTKTMENIIVLSYDKLPHHLKACFLYLGMFPEDFEIPVWKLTAMWIAEGFVQEAMNETLEETAYSYLDELINRNLVRKEQTARDGKVKTCRIHDMLREFCRAEAGKQRENFLQEIKTSTKDKTFHPSIVEIQNYRRLCIHSNVENFLSSPLQGPHVRSFACFFKEGVDPENFSTIPSAFKLLRVLEAKPIKLKRIPDVMYQLVHLKYITLSFSLAVLPTDFSKLWNIQTLIIDTTTPSCTLEIKANIWKFMQLRHFKTNVSATLPKIEKHSEGGDKIQTLGTISPVSCTEEVLNRVCKVKKLGIRGKLSMLLDAKIVSFKSLANLSNLEKLKLFNDAFPSAPSHNKLPRLPPVDHFPPNLRSLTLVSTYLEWKSMRILGELENLEVLKLKEGAFMGISWDVIDGGFRNLQVLYIGETDLGNWTANNHGSIFPQLRSLELRNCQQLQNIPIKLADVTSFHTLKLQCTKDAVSSAEQIRDRKQYRKEADQTGVKSRAFKLTISS